VSGGGGGGGGVSMDRGVFVSRGITYSKVPIRGEYGN
jgi:hypothetical protein